MTEFTYDIVGVGNAIVDVISQADDQFITQWNIEKNAMTLIDEQRADALTDASVDALETSGGSAANTIAGLASFGGKGAYIGKVADDRLGNVFRNDMAALNIPVTTPPLTGGAGTARSIILVTPDGHRSMNTFLGASVEFAKTDIEPTLIEAGGILYLEGYLFDKPNAKIAFVHAAEIAHRSGRRVALTLSDKFCVDRHRDSFRQLVQNQVDVLFANEEELLSLYETDNFDTAIGLLSSETELAAVTRSEKGSVVVSKGQSFTAPAHAIDKVVDTTGAGDQYAAGFLFGLSRGFKLPDCAALGHLAAAEVISHYGPRPEQSLRALAIAADLPV
ncbi:MAG: adenosine kinase [Hyphomonadaceae bacterium]|nr:adenosine kinase [Hyphomonadaceae bacterium]OUX94691.1 MAG: adenosine kinase [Hyphomonas sp. TMED17]